MPPGWLSQDPGARAPITLLVAAAVVIGTPHCETFGFWEAYMGSRLSARLYRAPGEKRLGCDGSGLSGSRDTFPLASCGNLIGSIWYSFLRGQDPLMATCFWKDPHSNLFFFEIWREKNDNLKTDSLIFNYYSLFILLETGWSWQCSTQSRLTWLQVSKILNKSFCFKWLCPNCMLNKFIMIRSSPLCQLVLETAWSVFHTLGQNPSLLNITFL